MGMFCPDLLQTILSYLPVSQVYRTMTVSKEWNVIATDYLRRLPKMGIIRPPYRKNFELLVGPPYMKFKNTLPFEAEFTLTVGDKNFHIPQHISLLPDFSRPQEIRSMLSLVGYTNVLASFSEKGYQAVQRGERVTIVNTNFWYDRETLSSYFTKEPDMKDFFKFANCIKVYAEDETPEFLKGVVVEVSPDRRLTVEERREALRKMKENTIFLDAERQRLGFMCRSYHCRQDTWNVFTGVPSKFL